MKIHFIGIGGIGVSALAQYYLAKGHDVSGSDLVQSEITDMLGAKGVTVAIGQKKENITPGIDLVVHSPAVPTQNPELAQAKALGIKTISYPEALGELTKEYYTIAVSGSHGKSTTTSMIALVLEQAGLDPTVIVGTKLKEFGDTNFRMGKSKYLVIEACEYDGSFLNYEPKITVVTNVDKEHLDYFKTFDNVKKTFREFIEKLPADGFLVANQDDGNMPQFGSSTFTIRQYSTTQPEATYLREHMQIPGMHNVSNGLAAIEVARILQIPDEVSLKTICEYKGSWRRFEIKESTVNNKHVTVVSDYGHHPNEVKATLVAAREKYKNKAIWCIFQPHQYQRTHYLFEDFVTLFKQISIDHVIITDIYDVAGREKQQINATVNSQKLVEAIGKKHVQYLPMSDIENFVKQEIKSGEVLIIMGAGDIYKLFDQF